MAKIEIVTYDRSQAESIADELRDFEIMSIGGSPSGREAMLQWFDIMETQAILVTFMAEDRVAAIFAGMRLNATTLEVWAYTGKVVDESVREFWKASVRGLESLLQVHEGLTRIQCHVDERHVKSRAWVERLGFHNETPDGMRNYGSENETYMLYAKTIGGNHG